MQYCKTVFKTNYLMIKEKRDNMKIRNTITYHHIEKSNKNRIAHFMQM